MTTTEQRSAFTRSLKGLTTEQLHQKYEETDEQELKHIVLMRLSRLWNKAQRRRV